MNSTLALMFCSALVTNAVVERPRFAVEPDAGALRVRYVGTGYPVPELAAVAMLARRLGYAAELEGFALWIRHDARTLAA